jgi:hypothetical protein
LTAGPSEEFFGGCGVGGCFCPGRECPVLAADDLLGDLVEVIVGVRDHGAGDLKDEADQTVLAR